MRKFIRLLVPTVILSSLISATPSEASPILQKVVTGQTLSVGSDHTCAVTVSGIVRCWGFNGYGQTTVPSDLDLVTQVTAGSVHTCAVTVSGFVRCWGFNGYGQTTVPSDLDLVSQVTAGSLHTCAVTVSGLVRCWGDNSEGQTTVPSDLDLVTQVTAGRNHTCAVTVAGLVRCWGHDNQLESTVPSDLGWVTQVSAGPDHTCAVTVSGLVRCWGHDNFGQRTVPSDLGWVTQVSAGQEHTCAVTAEGRLRCWGISGYQKSTVPSDLGFRGSVSQVSAGPEHTCAVTVAGPVRCWGQNDDGETTVPTDASVSQISAGAYHSCAVTVAGLVRCWGNNNLTQSTVPSDVGSVIQVSAGGAHTCAVTVAGLVRCWGRNQEGQSTLPSNLGMVTQISAGLYHSCAVTVAGLVRCWGYDNYGQRTVPSDLGLVTQISAGLYHTCAVTVAGLVRCWGDNGAGQTTVPSDLGLVTQVSAGGAHTCAVTVAGLVRCWGDNGAGQITVSSGATASQISAGGAHTCAVTVAGLIRCWGYDGYGQITTKPFWVSQVTQVSAGIHHTCAVAGGYVSCWGDNTEGQTKVPSREAFDVAIMFKQPKVTVLGVIEGAITGAASLGSRVAAEFVLDSSKQFSYQWFRDGLAISGSTQSSYVITGEDFGSVLTVELFNQDASGVSFGMASKTVAYPSLDFAEPSILGVNSVGKILVAAVDVSDAGVSYSYQWLRNGQPIPGANSPNYSVGLSDLDQDLSVSVSGIKDQYSPTSRTSKSSRALSFIANPSCVANIDDPSAWRGTPSQPSISGSPVFGQTLKGVSGAWTSGTKFCVFWIADGVVVPKATSLTYKLQGSDVGKKLQLVVVGTDKNSKRVARISEPLLVAKANFTSVKTPIVKGAARVGVKSTASLSSWGTGTIYSYQWLRDSEEIPGATTSSYTPTVADVASNLSLKVCGSKPFFESLCLVSSPQTVIPGLISKVGQVSIGGTSTNIGATLLGKTTQWMPGIELSWQWLADGVAISGATANTYTIRTVDRGKSISLRVTGDALGYQSISKITAAKKIP